MTDIQDIPVESVEPNRYNPNVLKGEKYDALKKDVEAGNYDPILVSPKDIFYGKSGFEGFFVIVDGEYRWKAAVELGLTTVKSEIRDIPLSRAKIITFRKNRERGNLDPFKEAKLFDEEVKAGLTEEKIAERFGVSRSYVAGRRSLLNVSAEVVELFETPQKKLKERLETKIRKDVEVRREMPEYVEVTDEEVEAHIEEQVAEIVPRGTLTPGHLKALASLPAEQQIEIAEDTVHTDLSVRETEGKVKRAHEKLERAKRFKEALEKARQETCPYCGAPPKGFSHVEGRFACSKCYENWDPMVTKKELEEQKKKRKEGDKTERSKNLQENRKNPGFIRRNETVEDIDVSIRAWLLRKVNQLDGIESIRITGTRGKEVVHIEYPGSYHNLLEFQVGVERKKHDAFYRWDWKREFRFSMEKKEYKTLEAKSKLDLHVAATPERRVEIHNFLDQIVKTEADPFIATNKAIVKALLKKYGEAEKQ